MSERDPPGMQELIAENDNLTVYHISRIFYLIANCIAINSKEDGIVEGQKIARICNYFRKIQNRMIASFLVEQRVTTSLEVQKILMVEDYTVSRAFKTLSSLGIIEKKGRIGSPYKTSKSRGAGVPLWGLLEAEPQDYVDAQKRYGEILLSTQGPDVQVDLLEVKAYIQCEMGDRREADLDELLTPKYPLQVLKKAAQELGQEGYKIWA